MKESEKKKEGVKNREKHARPRINGVFLYMYIVSVVVGRTVAALVDASADTKQADGRLDILWLQGLSFSVSESKSPPLPRQLVASLVN